jgi:Spy/CpxP family protein refolding chaperone
MKPTQLIGRCIALVTLVLFLATPADAQGKWWQSDQYRHELALTQKQSQALEDVFQKALPKLRIEKKALDDAEKQFEQFMQRGDYHSVMEQVDRVEAARAQLNKTRALMLVDMRKLLTTDQWIKLDALHQAAEGKTTDQHKK